MKKLSYFSELNSSGLSALEAICTQAKLKKSEVFVRRSDNNQNFMLIKKGIIRGYFYDEAGLEQTLFIPNDFGISGVFYNGKLAKYYFDAVEETEILIFNITEFENVANQHKRIMDLYLRLLKNSFHILASRLEILTTQKPCNRLDRLFEQYPNIVRKVKRKYLASFLGITPNSLSRIAARMKNAKKLS